MRDPYLYEGTDVLLLKMHKYIFQDMYDWAGQQRKQNIYKEEHVLGGLSIDYSDVFDIQKDSDIDRGTVLLSTFLLPRLARL